MSEETEGPEVSKPLAGVRVLICEDEGFIQMMIRRVFKRAGLDIVGFALTGREAVEIALQERPSLILMDIAMPEMDGLEATEQILAVYTPCIVIASAYAKEVKEKALAVGACGYVAKPFTPESLLWEIERIYQRYQST